MYLQKLGVFSNFLRGFGVGGAGSSVPANSWTIETDPSNILEDPDYLLVDLSNASAAFWANVETNGSDIIVKDSTETEILYELIWFNSVAETGWMAIEVPSDFSTSSPTRVSIIWDDTPSGNFRNIYPSDLKAVWHFKEDYGAGATTSTDSTLNTVVADEAPSSINDSFAGAVGDAPNFDGADDRLTVDDTTNPPFDITGQITLSAWVEMDTAAINGEQHFIVSKKDFGSNDSNFEMGIGQNSGTNTKVGFLWSDGVIFYPAFSDGEISLSTFTHVAVTFDFTAKEIKFYINGSLDTTFTITTEPDLATNTDDTYIGSVGGNQFTFDGRIDELLISDVVKSANWFATHYNMINSNDTFWTSVN